MMLDILYKRFKDFIGPDASRYFPKFFAAGQYALNAVRGFLERILLVECAARVQFVHDGVNPLLIGAIDFYGAKFQAAL